jgi:quercetin dioxygenase-like cupin family protein
MITTSRTLHHAAQGSSVTFLKTSVETGGRYTLLECTLAPGGSIGRHVHRTYEKTYEVTEGVLGVEVRREARRLYTGDRFVGVRHVEHRLFNAAARPCTFLLWIAPGEPGFEAATQILYGLAADGLTRGGAPRDPRIVGLLFELSDVWMPGWPALLEPWWRWQARRARRAGLDRLLFEQYVRF